jgi:hypothetical protein
MEACVYSRNDKMPVDGRSREAFLVQSEKRASFVYSDCTSPAKTIIAVMSSQPLNHSFVNIGRV